MRLLQVLDNALSELGSKIARLQLAEIEERHGEGRGREKTEGDGTSGLPLIGQKAVEQDLVQQVVLQGWVR